MYAVGRIGSYISQGVYTASGPFHPFGGAVDIIVVQQQDGSFKSSPWYVRFGKFQGVLKSKEKVVNISVNGVDADFHMYLDNKGEAYFLGEVGVEEEDPVCCISSSGEEADGKPSNRRQVKSKSFDYDSDQATSVTEINLSHGKILTKTNSCKSRIWGFVFGRKSMERDRFPEEGNSTGVLRTESLERAEIAADLLEVKWSTNSLPTGYDKDVDSTSSVLPVSNSDADKGLQIDDQNSKVDPVESNSENGRSHEEERPPVLEKMYSSMSTLPEAESFLVKSGVEMSCAVDGNGDQANESLHVPYGCGEVCAEAESLNEMTELISEVSFQPEACLLVAKECFSIEGGYSDDNCCKCLNDATVLENEEISSCSLSNNTVTETYSQILTIHRVNGSIEEVELQGLVSITGFENSSDQIVDEIVTDKEDSCSKLKLSLQLVGDPQHITDSDNDLTESTRISPSEGSEEEQLPFGELDDFKSGGNACIDSDLPDPAANEFHPSFISRDIETSRNAFSSFPEANSLPEKFIQKDFQSDEDLRIGPKRVSSEIDIPASGKVVGEEDRRIVKSLPSFWSHEKNAHDLSESSEVITQNESSQEQAANKNTVSGDLKTVPSTFAGDTCKVNDASGGSWRLWSFPFKKSQSTREIQPDLNCKRNPEAENASKSSSSMEGGKDGSKPKVSVKEIRVLTPTTEQLASLNLKEGRNEVVFTFATGMLGNQQVDARIYLWRWDTRIVISDVDGTITKSDVLGQFMPLVGMDWSQTGVTHFFSAIKENGYQFLFLSARSISQAYHTRKFLFNLKQDGKALPDGPVVISPDGLFPSLFREVIRRAPHEFKIACLEEIKALFPSDRNPFYAGFGNRDTDEISYLKVGIPKGKIFIINPKGEVSVHRRVDTKSYTSLNALVHGMFPSISSSYEQEYFNSWNYWRLPPPGIGI